MKTVESARLYFKNDKSDKVYDVDLCEVEDGLYIVNFRYGKRNSNLREGTKTVFPVTYDEAKRSFDQLVLSKTKKGYLYVGEQPVETVQDIELPIGNESIESEESIKIQKAILRNLKDIKSGIYEKDWTASRIIWRVGELKIAEAESYTLGFLKSTDFQEQYASIWTLGRLKSEMAANEIHGLWKSASSPIKDLCSAALLDYENPHQKEVKMAIESQIPSLLKDAILAKNQHVINNGIADFVKPRSKETAALWINLYLLSFDNESLRSSLKEKFLRISTKLHDFKAVRKIYKLAEFRDDFEFLAICAKKTAIQQANYGSNSWAIYMDNRYVNIREEKVKPNSRLAFSSATKAYFNRRTFRRLRKLHDDNAIGYIEMATEILLSVDDQLDKQKEFSTYSYNENWEWVEKWFPKYHLHTAYNFILYGNSDRIKLGSKKLSFAYLPGLVPDKSQTTKREEQSSAIWDKAPEAICRILANAKVLEVNEFALKVFNANPHFKNSLSTAHLAAMASSKYEVTANKAVELVKELYAGKTLPFELILGLLGSPYIAATNTGKEALKEYINSGSLSSENIVEIILFGQAQPLELFENAKLAADQNAISFSQIASILYDDNKDNEAFFRALIKFTAQENVGVLFSDFSAVDIEQFVQAQQNYLKEFGLLLIRLNKQATHELAAPILDAFLNSEDHLLRAAAMALIADFPDDFLLQKTELIKKFVFADHKEIRESIVPVVQKLIPLNGEFKESLFNALLTKICEQEEIEGSHQDHLALLQNCFGHEISALKREMIIELLLSSVDAAQKLGEAQFHKQGLKNELKLQDWTVLKDSDVFSIRTEIQHFYANNISTIMSDLDECLKILESKWADLRNWAMNFFLENSSNENWTLEQILMVADSPKEDVQSFARSLISKLFSGSHGKELMVHLSEHPSRSMMLFNSNYLNIYAKDHPEVIIQLRQYFKNILYGVNLGAASKARVYAFLLQELKKDEQVAQMTLDIISEILVTAAIGDKSNCIDLTLEIAELYPNLELPISVSPINTYSNAIQS